MKKLNQKGFALAETLIVTVFLMVLFGMIYSSFFPLIGEYEKREVYDDIDGKYSVYWIKRMIESSEYNLKKDVIGKYGYVRFQCKDLSTGDSKTMCKDIVKSLSINNCDPQGNNCDIFITTYKTLGEETNVVYFKNIVNPDKSNVNKTGTSKKRIEECNDMACSTSGNYVAICNLNNDPSLDCDNQSKKPIFSDGFKTYQFYLPNYSKQSSNGAKYRVFAIFHNTKDSNNYYSYATIEVNR